MRAPIESWHLLNGQCPLDIDPLLNQCIHSNSQALSLFVLCESLEGPFHTFSPFFIMKKKIEKFKINRHPCGSRYPATNIQIPICCIPTFCV